MLFEEQNCSCPTWASHIKWGANTWWWGLLWKLCEPL